nr:putative reverse transcriptase domain-containing protein [Tanacetum cinerariifolium]
EEPIEIMDREVKSLKHSRIPIVKVCWNSRRGPEYTWEREDYFQKSIRICSRAISKVVIMTKRRDVSFLRGGGCDTP